jgi:hypothetical protein
MADTNKINGGTSQTVTILGLTSGVEYGCPDTPWGAGQSLDVNNEADKQELKDGSGNTVAVAYHNRRTTQSYTVKIKGAVPVLKSGQVLVVNEVPMILSSWKKGYKNDDFTELSLELETYENITVTAPA